MKISLFSPSSDPIIKKADVTVIFFSFPFKFYSTYVIDSWKWQTYLKLPNLSWFYFFIQIRWKTLIAYKSFFLLHCVCAPSFFPTILVFFFFVLFIMFLHCFLFSSPSSLFLHHEWKYQKVPSKECLKMEEALLFMDIIFLWKCLFQSLRQILEENTRSASIGVKKKNVNYSIGMVNCLVNVKEKQH